MVAWVRTLPSGGIPHLRHLKEATMRKQMSGGVMRRVAMPLSAVVIAAVGSGLVFISLLQRPSSVLAGAHEMLVSVAVAPSGKQFVVGYDRFDPSNPERVAHSEVSVRDTLSLRETQPRLRVEKLNALSYVSSDYLLTGADNLIRVWDLSQGCQRAEWQVPVDLVRVLSCSPDTQFVAVGGSTTKSGGVVCLIERATQSVVWQIPVGSFGVTALAFSPDGKWLACGDWGEIQVIEVSTGKVVQRFSFDREPHALAFSPDGKWLAAGGYQQVTVWDLAGVSAPRQLDGHPDWVHAVAFSNDGKWLLTGGVRVQPRIAGMVRVWDGQTLVLVRELSYDEPVMAIGVVGNGATVIGLSSGRCERVYLGSVR